MSVPFWTSSTEQTMSECIGWMIFLFIMGWIAWATWTKGGV